MYRFIGLRCSEILRRKVQFGSRSSFKSSRLADFFRGIKFSSIRPEAASLASLVSLSICTSGTAAFCASVEQTKKEEIAKEVETGNQMIDMVSAALVPAMGPLTLGSVMGYATGYALQTIGKGVALFVGCSFMMIQGCAYSGYLNVDWHKASKDIRLALDVNNDGQLDASDAKILFKKFVDVCTFNLPSGAGFTLGLFLGLGFTTGTAGKAAAVALSVPRVAAMATGGSGVVVTLKERWESARDSASQMVAKVTAPKVLSEEEIFMNSLPGKSLPELRATQSDIKKTLSSLSGADKEAAQKKLDAVEDAKKKLKDALKAK